MSNLSNEIEQYIKNLIDISKDNVVEIRRNELAIDLRCVPSQINYVLQTRFSPERGYKVESQRGGGGYIRISKISSNATDVILLLGDFIDEGISHGQCKALLTRLVEEGIFTKREGKILIEITRADVLRVPLPLRDKVRAEILKNALVNVIEENWR